MRTRRVDTKKAVILLGFGRQWKVPGGEWAVLDGTNQAIPFPKTDLT